MEVVIHKKYKLHHRSECSEETQKLLEEVGVLRKALREVEERALASAGFVYCNPADCGWEPGQSKDLKYEWEWPDGEYHEPRPMAHSYGFDCGGICV